MSRINVREYIPFDILSATQEVGERIALARKARGWRQEDLCSQAEVSRSTLVEIEKGSPHVTLLNYLRVLSVLDGLPKFKELLPVEGGTLQLVKADLPRRVRLKASK